MEGSERMSDYLEALERVQSRPRPIHRAIKLANGLATAGAAGFLISIMAAEGNMIVAAIASGLALASIMAARFLWAEIEEVTGRNDLTRPEVKQ